jgi:two-component system response regulator AtoC
MVREQRFREDLYYRLKVVPLRVPPLRERREDILPLARHFLEEFNRQFQKRFQTIDPEAERFLLTYPWPGNIRELRNLFERIVLLNQGSTILPQHLQAAVGPPHPPRAADTPLSSLHDVLESHRLPESGFDLEGALGTVEREIIQLAFDQTRGNQSRAATLLGMKRDKLRYRMKLYGFQDATTEVG